MERVTFPSYRKFLKEEHYRLVRCVEADMSVKSNSVRPHRVEF